MKATTDTGLEINLPDTTAISQEALANALVWNPAGVVVVYDAERQLGAVHLPGAPVWQCWTPISREDFMDAVGNVANAVQPNANSGVAH